MAGKVRLFEHDEFEQAVVQTAAALGLSEQFVEKDYYVTEILRVIVDHLGNKAMFKGGTSLSKGWGLITRFSEDIDLFVNPDKFDPPPGKNKMDKILKELAKAVADHPALTWLDEGETFGGLGREDYFEYATHFDALPGIRSVVRLEPGVQSGTFPTEVVPITSLVGQFLQEQGSSIVAEDITGFDMTLLHFRRTFVEKLFALHGKVVRLQDDGHALNRDARHYSDLYALADQHQVKAMLGSDEYRAIREDYDENSRRFFPKSYRPPDKLSFASSPALFPEGELREALSKDYETQCELLFSGGDYPAFVEVLARFETIRHLL